MKKFLTLLLSLCTAFSALAVSACDEEDSGNSVSSSVEATSDDSAGENSDSSSGNGNVGGEERVVTDTKAAFTDVVSYNGSYTIDGKSVGGNNAKATYKVTSDFPGFTPSSDSSEFVTNFTDDILFTYDAVGKKAGEKTTSWWKDDEGERTDTMQYSYIPSGSGYVEYKNENGQKSQKAMTQKEIEESIYTIPQGLAMIFFIDANAAKSVSSKEEIIALFQEGAKKMTAEMNQGEEDVNLTVSYLKYDESKVNGANKYTFTYETKVTFSNEEYGDVTDNTDKAEISLYVKDGKLVKIESDFCVKYTAKTKTIQSVTDNEGNVVVDSSGNSYTYTMEITTTSVSRAKTVFEVSYEYDDTLIPTDFSDYVAATSEK